MSTDGLDQGGRRWEQEVKPESQGGARSLGGLVGVEQGFFTASPRIALCFYLIICLFVFLFV